MYIYDPLIFQIFITMDYTLSRHSISLPAQEYIKLYRDEVKFLTFCQECNRFGRCWACPPYEFDTTAIISKYRYVHLLGCQITLSPQLVHANHTAEQRKAITTTILEEVRLGFSYWSYRADI